jgi:hypothetical protein
MYKTYDQRNPNGGTVKANFFAYDSFNLGHADRCLFFATSKGLELLENAHELYADGTFSITPGKLV